MGGSQVTKIDLMVYLAIRRGRLYLGASLLSSQLQHMIDFDTVGVGFSFHK